MLRALAKGCSGFGWPGNGGGYRIGLAGFPLEFRWTGAERAATRGENQGITGALGEGSPEVRALAKGCSAESLPRNQDHINP